MPTSHATNIGYIYIYTHDFCMGVSMEYCSEWLTRMHGLLIVVLLLCLSCIGGYLP